MPLVTRAAHAATAAYQRAMTSLYQQENQRLQQENQRLQNEVRHCYDVIDVMGRDIEADEERHAREVKQAYLRGVVAATGVVRWPSAETLRAARNLARKVIDAERRRG